MSALEIYLKAAKDTSGLRHIEAIRNTRRYINISSREDIWRAIGEIKDPDLLRLLFEVGLTSDQQQVVLNQLKRIEEGKL